MFTVKKSNLFIIFLLISLNVYFISRLVSFELRTEYIFPFIIGYNFIILFNIIAFFYFQDYINPISAYSIFLFCFLFSFIPLSNLQLVFSVNGVTVLIMSALSFFLGAMVFNRIRFLNLFPIFTLRSKRIILFSVLFMCVFSFLIEISKMGYLPLLNVMKHDVYGDTSKAYTPLLNTFILMSAVIPAWSMIYYRKKLISRFEHQIILMISIFILINHLGRQMFLVGGLSLLAYYNYFNKIEYRRLAIVISGGVILFLFIGFLRTGSLNALDKGNEIIKRGGGIKFKTNIVESYLVWYSSVRFSVFEEMLEKKEAQGFWGLGSYTFRPIFKMTGLSKVDYLNKPEFDSLSRLGTYAIEPFLDAGMIGVILVNFLYGFFVTYFFGKYTGHEGTEYIVVWAIILFCMLMMPFTNTFNTFFTWIVLLTNKFLLKE
jgi:oligosaccharide repeat unit polymerase